MSYEIAVEGLQPNDTFGSWSRSYKVSSTNWKGGGQKVITLEVEDTSGRVMEKKFKTNTMLHILNGPTYEWRNKIEIRKRDIDFCDH